jgi:hypothetical protein
VDSLEFHCFRDRNHIYGKVVFSVIGPNGFYLTPLKSNTKIYRYSASDVDFMKTITYEYIYAPAIRDRTVALKIGQQAFRNKDVLGCGTQFNSVHGGLFGTGTPN